MSWLKKGGSKIQLPIADEMIARFQRNNPDKKIKAVYFDKEGLNELLKGDAAGVSIYFASNEDGTDTVVLRAVDAEGNLIKDAQPLEVGNPCPPYCAK